MNVPCKGPNGKCKKKKGKAKGKASAKAKASRERELAGPASSASVGSSSPSSKSTFAGRPLLKAEMLPRWGPTWEVGGSTNVKK